MKQMVFYRKELTSIIFLSILSLMVLFIFQLEGHAQTTIGSALKPAEGSLLDLKEREPADDDQSTANKGLKLPRVVLSDAKELYPMFLNEQTNDQLNKAHAGMLVYNVGKAFPQGIYYWDGAEWRVFDNSPAIPPHIESIICDFITADEQTFTEGDTKFQTLVHVPYTGGNGAIYSAGDSIPCMDESGLVTGLKVRLQAGKLANGAGELIYRVWASPSIKLNKSKVAKFPISFPENGDDAETCEISLGSGGGKIPVAKTESFVSVGPLAHTISGEDNNVPGYERVVTTPDGRWSMRAFVPSNAKEDVTSYVSAAPTDAQCSFALADISIRANNMDADRTIMWTGDVVYKGGDFSGSNWLYIPKSSSDIWGGSFYGSTDERTGGTDFWTIYPTTALVLADRKYYQVSLGNPDVFYVSTPENRVYTFTEVGKSDGAGAYSPQTVYTFTFMMGVAGSDDKVTDKSAEMSTVYFKVEQSIATE